MKLVKKAEEYTVFQKRSGRYAVRTSERAWVNGPDKIKILLEAGLIKANVRKETQEESVIESENEESVEITADESEPTLDKAFSETDDSSE